ncbi:MAG: L-histidine N(alpha)-methyltransferase [Bacillota bacterium]|jgi:L-histidine N-alpha-methyltransferase|nr:L-histidine N(alpha)-methyltransferase [Bacillota bacterium]
MHALSAIAPPFPAASGPLGAEVFAGLTASPKRLSPWLFYDERGSGLFEQITALPEYYLTRTERSILETHADAMVSAASGCGRISIMELGAGTATKTGLILQAAVRRQNTVTYYPIDVSETPLLQARDRLEADIPGVSVLPRIADYTRELARVETSGERRLVLYIGSSVGNFEPLEALGLLQSLRETLTAGDKLLLGVDMVKDVSLLLAAYDDSAGVTAAFNKNVLVRINQELGANFDINLFQHRAVWNENHSRIEMHLVSLVAQQVQIPALGLKLFFEPGESIHTENSYKFHDEDVIEMLERSGFHLSDHWTDSREWFGEYLATAW